MPNKIFENLTQEKINQFVTAYIKVSKEIFSKEAQQKGYIHSQEYGVYREKICKEFLKFFIPKRMQISDGFLITPNDQVSTQCDLVIFDETYTPNIQSKEMMTFYPIESVVGVIEVKSILDKGDLKETLNKLARIKALRRSINEPSFAYRSKALERLQFDPQNNPDDHIISVLICEKFNFNTGKMHDLFNNHIYEDDIEVCDRHNLVLSIEDGIIMYSLSVCNESDINCLTPKDKILSPDPIFNGKPLEACYTWRDGKNSHIKFFLNYFARKVSNITIMQPEFMNYLNDFNKVTAVAFKS
jgi:hypothetical protein